MPVIHFENLSSTEQDASLDKAAHILENEGLVVFPTDTVYGLALRLDSDQARERFYAIKERERGKPITRHINSPQTILEGAYCLGPEAKAFIRHFLPGPVTVLVKDRAGALQGFRCPANTLAQRLLKRCPFPVGASSVNKAGEKALCKAGLIDKIFSKGIDLVLANDAEVSGTESTIVDLSETPFSIVREGDYCEEVRRYLSHSSLKA